MLKVITDRVEVQCFLPVCCVRVVVWPRVAEYLLCC